MAYADPQDLINRYSSSTLGDLASDDPNGNAVTESGLFTDPKILAALSDGAGDINGAIYHAGIYQPADLAALEGDDAAMLIRMNCDLAFAYLMGRKTTSKLEDIAKAKEGAEKLLERLRSGANIFNIQGAENAGNPSVTSSTIEQYAEQNLIVDYCRRGRGQGVYPSRRPQTNFS